jgi:hypothetical protein
MLQSRPGGKEACSSNSYLHELLGRSYCRRLDSPGKSLFVVSYDDQVLSELKEGFMNMKSGPGTFLKLAPSEVANTILQSTKRCEKISSVNQIILLESARKCLSELGLSIGEDFFGSETTRLERASDFVPPLLFGTSLATPLTVPLLLKLQRSLKSLCTKTWNLS